MPGTCQGLRKPQESMCNVSLEGDPSFFLPIINHVTPLE